MSYLPSIYRNFQQQFPEITKAYEDLTEKCHNWGPLDEKTRQFIKLGVAIGVSSEGAVKSHARQALDEGATPEELHHAALLALTTAGFSTMIAGLRWVDEVIEKEGK